MSAVSTHYPIPWESRLKPIGKFLIGFGIHICPYHLLKSSGRDLPRQYEPADMLSPYRIEYLSASHVAELAGGPVSSASAIKLLSRGCKCLTASLEGKVVAYVWADLTTCQSTMLSFPLRQSEAYIFGAYTAEPFRGKNLMTYLMGKLCRDLAKEGRSEFYSIVIFSNSAGLRAQQKIGSKPLGLYVYINLFNTFSFNFLLKDYNQPTTRALAMRHA